MKNTIYYISATGGCLYVAKTLGKALGKTTVIRMVGEVSESEAGGKGERVGFVFPVYFKNIPDIVKDYILKLNINKDSFVFLVTSSGNDGSIYKEGEALFLKKGVDLAYYNNVKLVSSSIIDHEIQENTDEILEKAQNKLSLITEDLLQNKRYYKTGDMEEKTYEYIQERHVWKGFTVDDTCISCRFCYSICPVNAVEMVEEKPSWSEACCGCMACINWCPRESIQYKNMTQGKKRYINTKVKFRDMIRRRLIIK